MTLHKIKLENITEYNKTCVWYILEKPYEDCKSCNRYNDDCLDYIPLVQTDIERADRIMKNLHRRREK